MTTAMTRATIAIVRVSMARPYSVSRAVSRDPPSGTPLPLKTDWGRLERVLADSRPDEDQASAGAPSTPSSLLHLWKGSSAAVATEFHATGHCPAVRTISTRASSRTSASASGRRRAERMIPADEDVLRAHVRVSQVCHVRPEAWRVGDRELMDELDRERIARSSRSLLGGLRGPVAGVIRAASRRRAPALPWLFVWRSPTARVVILERQRDGDLAFVDGPAMPAAVEPTHRARPRPGHGSDAHARTPAPGLRAAGRASPARRAW
jgi:hypothetical protein